MLLGGFPYTPCLIGLFVISEIFVQLETINEKYVVPKQELKGLYMTFKELKDSFWNFIRSGMIGIGIGILPGIGSGFSNIVCYDQVRKASKNPETFGKGNIQGIVASECGNNATIGGALIPMVALGIPGDGITAALIGGLMIQGITPGPLFIRDNPGVLYGIFNALLLSSFVMLVFYYAIGLRVFPVALRLPKYVLLPVVLIMAISGSYNISYSIRDIWCAVIMGFVGYAMDKFKFPKAPAVITMVLGASFERYLRRGLAYYDGSLLPMITRPYALFFVILTVLSVAVPIWTAHREKKRGKAAQRQPVK
jgi:putative tricarboxylic transport membrane protein